MHAEIMDSIYWVGFLDWNVRDFHSYQTDRGATYNSYLVKDEKTALIDTVKFPYWEFLLRNIKELTSLEKVDYIVCNHAEPDHGGSLAKMVELMPNAKVVCDEKCKGIIEGYHDTTGWNFHIVKSGETLSLGSKTLTFLETPMVHWPDSMMTYVPECKLLFSMDGFGQHWCNSHRFDDQVDLRTLLKEAKTYYANIVMPYGKQVIKTLEAASTLEIDMIAPSHGMIWRSHIADIVECYKRWSVCKAKPKVLVIYDTMWENTKRMAETIAEGASRDGVEVISLFVRANNNTRLVTEVIDCACLAVGSATLNQQMMPALASTLTYLKGLRPTGKAGFSFGSFGWGKGGPEAVHAELEALKFEILREPLKAKWKAGESDLEECRAAGAMLAEKALEIAGV